MAHKRRPIGATMGLVVALTLVIALIGVFIVFLVKLLGGGEQMQRATDSGNLSLTRAELDQFTVPIPSSGDGQQFNGASDHSNQQYQANGIVSLRNINAVLGQAFLVNVNAAIMAQQGVSNGATWNAQLTTNAANNLATSLANAMANASTAFSKFQSTQVQNPTQEFGSAANTANGAPQFAYVDRKQPSNIYILPQQLADYDFATNKSPLYNTKIAPLTATVSSEAGYSTTPHQYLLGYCDGISPGNSFPNSYFVPLRPGARPHLVSRAVFAGNQVPNQGTNTFNWASPVGNAVSQATVKQDSHTAFANFAAYGQMQPIDANGVGLAIKHGFIVIRNGAPSPAQGFSSGNAKDVFVYVMNNHQMYAQLNGAAKPYFIGTADTGLPYGATSPQDYVNQLHANATNNPNCGGFNVGYAANGDSLGQGGVSAANCAALAAQDPGSILSSNTIDNYNLSEPNSAVNVAMAPYGASDPQGFDARPPLEAAYGIPPAQPMGSNNTSVSVGDLVNLALLSARAQGANFTLQGGQFQSGIAYIPTSRVALTSPNFMIAAQPEGASLASSTPGQPGAGQQGITKGGAIWNFLSQRFYEIDPTWTKYCPNGVDDILSQAKIPLNTPGVTSGRGIIYFSQSGNGGKGGIVLKEQNAALLDAPWLASFINQKPDGKSPTVPTEIHSFPLTWEGGGGGDANGILEPYMIDVDNDWGFPHPYDDIPQTGLSNIMNWFSFTPSSGYNNMLGQIDLGAINTPGGANCPSNPNSYTINVNAGPSGSDTVSLPSTGNCTGTTTGSGPC